MRQLVFTSKCGSYASGSLVVGRVTHAGLVLSEVPNKEREGERETLALHLEG
jgi:hypothetical protein